MKATAFDYHLPQEAIAQHPCSPRDSARMLVLPRGGGNITHRRFFEIGSYLRAGDVLVLNNTRVIPARLRGRKVPTGGKAEVFLLSRKADGTWDCLLRPGRRLPVGTRIAFSTEPLQAAVVSRDRGARGRVQFEPQGSVDTLLERAGQIPLPPYIHREHGPSVRDAEQYQTVYGREPGAVAAPTAGLHFTPRLLAQLRQQGVEICEITLHTGWASFRALPEPEVEDNALDAEYACVGETTAALISAALAEGRRVVAVGTTTTRALESCTTDQGRVQPFRGWTRLFIYPGYRFRVIDGLVTNFHMPRSSLILLVSAFAGRDRLLAAYREALASGYRFLSYGDGCLIV